MLKMRLSQKQVDLLHMFLLILILFVFAGHEAIRKMEAEIPETNFTATDSLWDRFSVVVDNR